MHTYSVDKDLREKATVFIFGLSMVLSLLLKGIFANELNGIINFLKTTEVEPVVKLLESLGVNTDILGISFLYGVLTFAYRKFIWKTWPVKKLHGVPNLEGIWEGSLKSTFDGKRIPMKMQVKQDWNKISFKCVFSKTESMSNSNNAAILISSNKGIEICFGFTNDSYDVDNKLQSYDGYNILNLEDENHIKARYFNNRDNPDPECKGGNKGTFELKRVKKSKKSKPK